MTQSDPEALDDSPAPLLDPLPTVTDAPLPPGDTVVEPLTPPDPAVIEVELVEEPSPSPCRVTTRHGLLLVTLVPFGPAVTEVLAARAGAAAIKHPTRSGRAVWRSRIECLRKSHGPRLAQNPSNPRCLDP